MVVVLSHWICVLHKKVTEAGFKDWLDDEETHIHYVSHQISKWQSSSVAINRII